MSTGSIYIDANVLLDVLLEREHAPLAERFLLAHAKDGLVISALTAHLVVHFGSEFHRLSVLRQFLSDYQILPLEAVDFEWAFSNARDDDFEDALQLAVAIHHGCEIFATCDKPLYHAYKTLPNIQINLLA